VMSANPNANLFSIQKRASSKTGVISFNASGPQEKQKK
jgi:hypothetical protein